MPPQAFPCVSRRKVPTMSARTAVPPTRTKGRRAVAFAVTLLTLPAGLLTFGGSPAHAVSPTCETEQDWSSIAYGNDRFVAVASAGAYRAMTSVDGSKRTPRKASANSC